MIARTPKIVLLTLAVSAALVGCGKNETPATDSAASTASSHSSLSLVPWALKNLIPLSS